MIAERARRVLPLTLILTASMALAAATGAVAAPAPIKLFPSGKIETEIEHPGGVVTGLGENVYVTERSNERVQELTPSGEFVLMFGGEVNETTKGDVCTAEEVEKSGVKCKAGVEGAGAGQFHEPGSITVDPATHNVFVQDIVNWRVQEFTPTGEFVLMFGKEVNETTGASLCTAEDIAKGEKCKAGVEASTGSTEPAAFAFVEGHGDLLAAGGPSDLVYVGDEGRVQKFHASTGASAGEVSLASVPAPSESKVRALALDQASGDLYIAYGNPNEAGINTVRVFNAAGVEQRSFEVAPQQPGAEIDIHALALDAQGHLAVSYFERGAESHQLGRLYTAATGQLITPFADPEGSDGLAFNKALEAELYATVEHEVLLYTARPVAELTTGASSCEPGAEVEAAVTFNCLLAGEVNPEGISETEAFFEAGRTGSLGEVTAKQDVITSGPLSIPFTGARPNQAYFYRIAAEDHNAKAPEQLSGETEKFTTPFVAAKVPNEPSASFVGVSSAVLTGQVNPENASTEYFFEYAQGGALASCPGVRLATCPGVTSTPVTQSSVFAEIGTTQELTGLQPASVYRVRLFAEDENAAQTERRHTIGPEGSFSTEPAALPQAITGGASAIGATSATISGTVNPDGQASTYAFELGAYEGAATQYGIVFSGSTGAGTSPVAETFGLSGLQPGSSYAFRIRITSGLGSATGVPTLFTTPGLPSVLTVPSPPALLATPSVVFPDSGARAASKPAVKALTPAQKLAAALRACKKDQRSKAKRASCERQARKQYGSGKTKKRK
jgi:hypothetical protein